MASEHVKVVTDQNFEQEVLRSSVPVLLDFTATWCGPCRALAPIVDALAQDYQGVLKVAKIDIDDSPNTPERFGIRGVPTVMLFKNGQLVDQKVGLTSKANLVQMLQGHLSV
jgi:thioredoxin 1